MRFNFKFLAFALLAMLCFSFGCAPTSSAAASVPSMEKTKLILIADNNSSAEVIRALASMPDRGLMVVVGSPDAPDDAFISQLPALDLSMTIDRLPEAFPNQKASKQKQSYISRNKPLTIKPPQSANLQPEIVSLC